MSILCVSDVSVNRSAVKVYILDGIIVPVACLIVRKALLPITKPIASAREPVNFY